jgi:hypothetical protein
MKCNTIGWKTLQTPVAQASLQCKKQKQYLQNKSNDRTKNKLMKACCSSVYPGKNNKKKKKQTIMQTG